MSDLRESDLILIFVFLVLEEFFFLCSKQHIHNNITNNK